MKETELMRLLSGIDPELIAEAAPKNVRGERFAAEPDKNAQVLSYDLREATVVNAKKHGKKRIIFPLIAAAVLLTGGVTAAVAFSGKPIVIETSKNTSENSADSGQETSKSELPEEFEPVKPENTLGLNLTDQQDTPNAVSPHDYKNAAFGPGTQPIAAPGGWYHQGWNHDSKDPVVLCYSDAETHETVPLCAKPECQHDGSLYCTASTRQYDYVKTTEYKNITYLQTHNTPELPVYYDGYLYRIAPKCDYGEDGRLKSDRLHTVLLRYEPDGTGITELYDFGECSNEDVTHLRGVLHRGYLWCCVRHAVQEEAAVGTTTVSNGFGIYGYELATGEIVTLKECPDANEMPISMFGSGDYLYVFENTYLGGDFLKGVIRISLLNGKSEPVAPNADFYVTDGKHMIWSSLMSSANSSQTAHITDLAAGEDIMFDTQKKNEYGNFAADFEKYQTDQFLDTVIYGDSIIAVSRENESKNISERRPYGAALYVYGMDGNRRKVIDFPVNLHIWDCPVLLNGKLYVQFCLADEHSETPPEKRIYWAYCSPEELLEKGADAEFTLAYYYS